MNRNQIATMAAPKKPAITPSKQIIALSDILRDFRDRACALANIYKLLILLLYIQQSVTYGVVLIVAVLPIVTEKRVNAKYVIKLVKRNGLQLYKQIR